MMLIFIILGNRSTNDKCHICFCFIVPFNSRSPSNIPYDYYYYIFSSPKTMLCKFFRLLARSLLFTLLKLNCCTLVVVVALFMDLVEVILVRLCNQNRQYRVKIISLELSRFKFLLVLLLQKDIAINV